MFTFQQLVAYLEGQGGGPEGEPRQELSGLQGKALIIDVEDDGINRLSIVESIYEYDLRRSGNLQLKIAAPDGLTDFNHVLSLLSPENLSRLIEELKLRGGDLSS